MPEYVPETNFALSFNVRLDTEEFLLTATVFSWDKDVTDELDDNQFIWTRVSSDSEADKVWNSAHFGGTKSITITNDDVKARATFYCDLIDTSTRESLLG